MLLSAPKKIVFIISAVLAAVGLLAQIGLLGGLAPLAFLITFVAYVLLALGVLLKGM